jgi:hypothetical protein
MFRAEFYQTSASCHRKEGWREVCGYMAAYMTAHQRGRPNEDLKIQESAREIHQLAAKDKVNSLPPADTINEQIAEAIELLRRSDFKLSR